MVDVIRGGALGGVVAAAALLSAGCGGAPPVADRIELADAIADSAGEAEHDRMRHLAAREDELGDDLHSELVRGTDELEPPADVADIIATPGLASTGHGTGPDGDPLLQVARVLMVVPEADEPFCAVIGLGSDGTASGTLADGDIDDDCRDARIPVQSQNAIEGNPLALWDQDSRWLDPRDPPPN